MDLLARLEAESAIRRLVGLYCDAVNRRDAEAAGRLFAPDCRIRIADGPERVGREVQSEGMRHTFAGFAFLRQQCDAAPDRRCRRHGPMPGSRFSKHRSVRARPAFR